MLYSVPRLGSLFPDLHVSTFRKTALGLTAAAAMFAGTAAHAGDFSAEDCKFIAHVGVTAAKVAGPEKLSVEFKTSFRNYLGANLTCDGPKNILTPTGEDVATFNTIRQVLLAPPRSISLEKAGVRAIDPRSAQRPADQRRSDAGPAIRANLKVD